MKYIAVTAAKDEEQNIGRTIESICAQTLRPERWIIVNDGSTDRTGDVVGDYAREHPWIDVVNIPETGKERAGGANVVNAFCLGYERIRTDEHDFLVKIDADVIFPARYFEEISREFAADRRLGMCGGYTIVQANGRYVAETVLDYHVRGAFKAIRKSCFEDIGGFRRIWNWDGIDEIEAMTKGWDTKAIPVPVIHLRPTSHAYPRMRFYFKEGYEAERQRNNVLLVVARAAMRAGRPPIILCSFAYLGGYVSAFLNREEATLPRDLSRAINRFHLRRIPRKKYREVIPIVDEDFTKYFGGGAVGGVTDGNPTSGGSGAAKRSDRDGGGSI